MFGIVALLHILLMVGLLNGLFRQVTHTVPAEVFVTLISAQTSAPQPKTSPVIQAIPKTTAITRPAISPLTESPVNETSAIENNPVSVPTELSTPVAAPAVPVTLAAMQPKTISSGVEYVRPPRPNYPLSSRRIHEEGKAVIRVLVNEQGMPAQAEVQQSSGSARLDEAAKLAVMGALFKPFMDNGKAMTVYALVPIRFQLDS